MKKTPFYDCHIQAQGKIVDFGGWALPVNYGSQIKEHETVRTDAGMFDVSHMQITDISGNDSENFLRYLISNDVLKLKKHGIGKALYSAMLNENAGIIDDLIVYFIGNNEYRIVSNGATREKDLAWIHKIANGFDVIINPRNDLAILAVQGPNSIAKVINAYPEVKEQLTNLKPFSAIENSGHFFARTGYTGENGLEIILPQTNCATIWNKLLITEVTPCGLGARDTLRLEAGMNLYGHDMDDGVNPSECNMDWVVDLTDTNRDFIGKEQYIHIKATKNNKFQVGIVLDGKSVLREGQKVIINNKESGIITSGTFSPTLKMSIAIARVENLSDNVKVDIRGNLESVKLVKLPFVRHGRILL